MKVKNEIFNWGQIQIGDGQSTRFWEYRWLLNRPLKDHYPNHFNVVRNKTALVAGVLSGAIPNLFSFAFFGHN
jgi:hypothetical protein